MTANLAKRKCCAKCLQERARVVKWMSVIRLLESGLRVLDDPPGSTSSPTAQLLATTSASGAEVPPAD